MFKTGRIIYFLIFYTALRVFSFYFQPAGYGEMTNGAICAAVIFCAAFLIIRNDNRGWLIVAAEIILGGSGNFLSLGGISLRTLLLISTVTIYFTGKCINGQLRKIVMENGKYFIVLTTLYAWLGFSAISGIRANHDAGLIISGLIPYLFLLYFLPLREIIDDKQLRESAFAMLVAAVIGSTAFMLITFAGYSSGIFSLQDAYYHWFRDVANGKITGFPFYFFRIVLNEQLLLIPATLWLAGKHIKDPHPAYTALIVCAVLILGINITRIYILALAVGLVFLISRINFRKWLTVSAGVLIIFFTAFTVIHLAASRGQSFGWELIGLRLQSITSPSAEDSSLSRMLILPVVMNKITAHPMLGSGLGDTVTVFSPVFRENITTPHFDWGYLQMIDETGLMGFSIIILTYFSLVFLNKKCNWCFFSQKKELYIATASLLIINITSPALFHVMGIVWIVFTAAETNRACAEPNPAPSHNL